MLNISETINDHYGFGGILSQILTALTHAGMNVDLLTVDDLAPIDEFHTRGRDSTLELAALAELKPQHAVLDVGCGLGGSARFIAQRFGCGVTGVDLTQEYIDVAVHLTEMVGLGDQVKFEQGSALGLPLTDDSFDIVWTEHAQMNIPDKAQFYSEIARVLKPGGRLLFHDIFRGIGETPIYPAPWAENESISFLATENEARTQIEQAGLMIQRWDDKDVESEEFFHRVFQRINQSGPPPIGIHLLMGDNARVKLENYLRNLVENRISVAMVLATATG